MYELLSSSYSAFSTGRIPYPDDPPTAPFCIVSLELFLIASFAVLPVIFAFFTTSSPLTMVVCGVVIPPA